MEGKIILEGASIEALIDHMRQVVREEIQAANSAKDDQELIDIKTVHSEIFNKSVSLPTIRNWAEHGYLKKHSIGRRIFFNRKEVLEAATKLSPYKKPIL